MPWIIIENPSKELLDSLWKKELENSYRSCHDCGVTPGEKHLEGCDTARCLTCGGQRLGCDCETGAGDIWDGMWPGTKECYEKGYVAVWEGSEPHDEGMIIFDYNHLALSKTIKSTTDKNYLT